MQRCPTRLVPVLAAIVLAMAACGGATQQIGTAAPASSSAPPAAPTAATEAPTSGGLTPMPTESATAAPTESATAAPSEAAVTPAPADATAPAASEPVISQRFFRVWTDIIGSAEYEIVIEVSNETSSPVDLGGEQDFTIYDTGGSVLETGSFTYAFPKVVAPGGKGYFVDAGFFDDGVKTKTVGKMEENLSWGHGTDPTPLFKVSNVKVSAESYGDGLQVSAVVTNTTGEDATMAVAGFIFFDGKGKIVGALYDNTVDKV